MSRFRDLWECSRVLLGTTALLTGLLALTACGDGSLDGDVDLARSDGLEIDLIDWQVRAPQATPISDAGWRTTRILLRSVSGPQLRVATDPWAGAGEARVIEPGPRYFIGVFELTQRQWQLLGGGEPWLAPALAGLVAQPDQPQGPAWGIDRETAERVLAAASRRLRGRLMLPSAAQWEYACRAGSAARFSWGNDPAPLVAGLYAQAAETTNAAPAPRRVGSHQPNSLGLFDVHGNVAELDRAGSARGGSWSDTIPACRAGGINPIDPSTPHGLVGVRVVYVTDE